MMTYYVSVRNSNAYCVTGEIYDDFSVEEQQLWTQVAEQQYNFALQNQQDISLEEILNCQRNPVPIPTLDELKAAKQNQLQQNYYAVLEIPYTDATTGIVLSAALQSQTRYTSATMLTVLDIQSGIIKPNDTIQFYDDTNTSYTLFYSEYLALLSRYGNACAYYANKYSALTAAIANAPNEQVLDSIDINF